MNRKDVMKKISVIMIDSLDEPTLMVDESLNRNECEMWDSVAHVTLIATLENEFGIRFSMEEMLNIKSVKELIDKIISEANV